MFGGIRSCKPIAIVCHPGIRIHAFMILQHGSDLFGSGHRRKGAARSPPHAHDGYTLAPVLQKPRQHLRSNRLVLKKCLRPKIEVCRKDGRQAINERGNPDFLIVRHRKCRNRQPEKTTVVHVLCLHPRQKLKLIQHRTQAVAFCSACTETSSALMQFSLYTGIGGKCPGPVSGPMFATGSALAEILA